ncbi:MAG: gliding motility-associated C-terminal domain-containing protein [Flavobacteriales bacterium]|nr:gliding motility-associated C-terminal domain-containing protein [Flavobacteriales bacterium]
MLAFLLIPAFNTAKAQENNVWIVDNARFLIKMDFNFEPPLISGYDDGTNFDWGYSSFDNVTLCNSNGELLYYTKIDDIEALRIFDSQHKLVLKHVHENLKIGACHFLFVHGDTLEILDYPSPEEPASNVYGNQNIIYVTTYQLPSFNKLRETKFDSFSKDSIWMSRGRFTIFNSTNAGVEYYVSHADTFNFYHYDFQKNTNTLLQKKQNQLCLEQNTEGFGGYHGYQLNNRNDKIFAVHSSNGKDNYLNGELYHRSNALSSLDVSEEGFIQSETCIMKRLETYIDANKRDIKSQYWFYEFAISPNDSFVYIMAIHNISQVEGYSKILKVNTAGNVIDEVSLGPKYSSKFIYDYTKIRLAPNGKIYVFPTVFGLTKDPLGRGNDYLFSDQVFVITNPNAPGKMVLSAPPELKLLNYYSSNILTRTFSVPNNPNMYKRVEYTTQNNCHGQNTLFVNNSDSSHFVRYRFYFGDGDSADMLNTTRLNGQWAVQHTYANAGKYFVKLRAFNSAGGWVWYSDSITILQSPKPLFAVADTMGCQWIGYDYIDKSTVAKKGKDVVYNWRFGDGTFETLVNPTAGSVQSKTYTKSGNYIVTLTINDGFCTDSFTLQNKVNILPAPQPGFLLSDNVVCSPADVLATYKFTDPVDSMQLIWGDGSSSTVTNQEIYSPVLHRFVVDQTDDSAMVLPIYQVLHGPTGCITRDTQWLKLYPSFDRNLAPQIVVASVEQNKVLTNWIALPHTKNYVLQRDNAQPTITQNLFFEDSLVDVQANSYTYTVAAQNQCYEKSANSNLGKTILLTGNEGGNNELSIMEWTAYETWPQGVQNYTVQVQQTDGSFVNVASLGDGSLNYTDNDFLASAISGLQTHKCYRIEATSTENNSIISHSNVLCVPYKPVLFIPNAFSPNGDGLNDVYQPLALGMDSFEMQCYNRWGELVFSGKQWNGTLNQKPAPLGAYTVFILVKTNESKWVREQRVVSLVR